MTCCADNTLQLVQGDTRPFVQLVLYDAQTNAAYDVSNVGTSVYFVLQQSGVAQAKEAILCQKLPGTVDINGVVTYPPAFANPGSGGRVQVVWTTTALNTAGSFKGKIQIFWNDGTTQTSFDAMVLQIAPQWAGLPMAPEPHAVTA